MRKINFLLKILLGVGILLLLFIKLPTDEIFSTFSSIEIQWYFIGILIFVLLYFLKYLRWRCLVKGMGMHFSLWELFIIYFKGVFLGLVTPGRLGEFGRAYFMADKSNQSYKGMASVLVDRVIDIGTLLLFAVLGIFFYKDLIREAYSGVLIQCALFLIAILGAAYIVSRNEGLRSLAQSFLLGLAPKSTHEKINVFFKGIITLKFNVFMATLILSIIAHLVWGVVGYTFLLSLGIKTSFGWLIWCMSVVAIISNLPFSYLGIGFRETAFAYFFTANHYLGSQGFGFGLLISSLWLWVGLAGFIIWMAGYNTFSPQGNVKKVKV